MIHLILTLIFAVEVAMIVCLLLTLLCLAIMTKLDKDNRLKLKEQKEAMKDGETKIKQKTKR